MKKRRYLSSIDPKRGSAQIKTLWRPKKQTGHYVTHLMGQLKTWSFYLQVFKVVFTEVNIYKLY